MVGDLGHKTGKPKQPRKKQGRKKKSWYRITEFKFNADMITACKAREQMDKFNSKYRDPDLLSTY